MTEEYQDSHIEETEKLVTITGRFSLLLIFCFQNLFGGRLFFF